MNHVGPAQVRTGLQYAAWIVLVSVGLIPFLDPSQAEFFVTAFCLFAGLLFGALLLALNGRSMR